MKLRFDEENGILIVAILESRLDALAAPDFRSQVAERAAGRAVVVLDLLQVKFIDSSGLAAIISVLKQLLPGGQVRLARAGEPVQSLLRLTRLDRVFSCYPEVTQALKSP
jgi:anti-sigma B factor antagonist